MNEYLLIDDKFKIIKNFGASDENPCKMVFLVQHKTDRKFYVLKAYTLQDKENFITEVRINKALAYNS